MQGWSDWICCPVPSVTLYHDITTCLLSQKNRTPCPSLPYILLHLGLLLICLVELPVLFKGTALFHVVPLNKTRSLTTCWFCMTKEQGKERDQCISVSGKLEGSSGRHIVNHTLHLPFSYKKTKTNKATLYWLILRQVVVLSNSVLSMLASINFPGL